MSLHIISAVKLTPELAEKNKNSINEMNAKHLKPAKLFLNAREYIVASHWLNTWMDYKVYRDKFFNIFLPAVADPHCIGVISCYCYQIPSELVQSKNIVSIYDDYRGMCKVWVHNNTLYMGIQSHLIDSQVLRIRAKNFPYALTSAKAFRELMKYIPLRNLPDADQFDVGMDEVDCF